MPKSLFASVALVSGLCMGISGCDVPETGPYRAIDGDTISVGSGPHIRLLRIDAPELPGHPCADKQRTSCDDSDPYTAIRATFYLQVLLDRGRIKCYNDFSRPHDVYGRRLAECKMWTDGGYYGDLSDEMLKSGLVYPYRWKGRD